MADITKQRALIKQLLCESKEHPTAERLFEQAKIQMPTIAIGTVYRNLHTMTENGEIRKITVFDGPDRYDGNVIPHEHMYCENCGKLTDICVPDMRCNIERGSGVKVRSYELNVVGICTTCVRSKA